MNKIAIPLILLTLAFVSCKSEKAENDVVKDWSTEKSTEFSKRVTAEEEIEIRAFLARKPQWKMTKSGTGLHYFISGSAEGPLAQPEDYVDVEYKISLLDGTVCYQTDADEVEEFKVDRAQVESGVQEGIKLMSQGQKAVFIIPSHLAHGIAGDMSKIPPLSTILVELTLIKLYQNPKNATK